MRWPDDREVPVIQGGHGLDPEPFGSSDHRGVHGPEGKIAVCRNKFRDPDPVGGCDRLRNQLA